MHCSSTACTTDCIACNSGIAPAPQRQARASEAPVSAHEALLMRGYRATVSQRKTVTAADVGANFVCELARGQS